MSLTTTVTDVEYPESDGQPMGETDLHRDWMFRILELLRWRYRGERVYVASNLLVYYQQGVPRNFVVPDDFVVTDCEPGRRRTFKIWEEGKTPEVVFEVTSRSTRREDEVFKPRTYARIGVREYFLYDPTADYLSPPLKGYRLKGGEYLPIEADAQGTIHCEHLGISLRLQGLELLMFDSRSGQLLRTAAEAAEEASQAAEAQRQEADAQRRVAEAQWQEADAQRRAAEAQWQEADAQRRAAEAQWQEADAQRRAAEAQRQEADAQRQAAEAQRLEAERRRDEAETVRQAAERRTQELEAEIERLRRELARRIAGH